MLNEVTKFTVDDRHNLYIVGLRNGKQFTGWEACRTIRVRNKIQGDFKSPLEVYIDKKDVKELEETQKKKKK